MVEEKVPDEVKLVETNKVASSIADGFANKIFTKIDE